MPDPDTTIWNHSQKDGYYRVMPGKMFRQQHHFEDCIQTSRPTPRTVRAELTPEGMRVSQKVDQLEKARRHVFHNTGCVHVPAFAPRGEPDVDVVCSLFRCLQSRHDRARLEGVHDPGRREEATASGTRPRYDPGRASASVGNGSARYVVLRCARWLTSPFAAETVPRHERPTERETPAFHRTRSCDEREINCPRNELRPGLRTGQPAGQPAVAEEHPQQRKHSQA